MSLHPRSDRDPPLAPPSFFAEEPLTPASSASPPSLPVHVDTFRSMSPALPLEQCRRALRELAAERVDEASHTFFACALLVVTAGAIALSSTSGPRWLSVVAIALVAAAVGIITAVRLRLRRDLERAARAQGMDPAQARAETTELLRRTLQLD